MKKVTLFLLILRILVSENLFDLYNAHSLDIEFHNPNYDQILKSRWEIDDKTYELATIIFNGDTLDKYLGHEIIEINEESAKSKLVINKNHHQPMGLVHGGIYSTLAETLCSYGANFNSDGMFVGVNNNTDFLSSVSEGELICSAKLIKKGRSYQLWEAQIQHENKLCAVSKVRLSRIK